MSDRIKDLAPGIVAIMIGIILWVVTYSMGRHFYAMWFMYPIAAVFIIIGIVYLGWKFYRIKK